MPRASVLSFVASILPFTCEPTPAPPPPDPPASCDPAAVAAPAICGGDGFVAPAPAAGWRHLTTELLVVTQGPPNHRGIDVVVPPRPGEDTWLIGKFAYGLFDKDLEDEDVQVWLRPDCGAWVLAGTARTSHDGQYGTIAGVDDDGGRVFFPLGASALPGPGVHPVKMLVSGDHSEANFWLHVWPDGAHAVVSDIDGTITTEEFDGLWSALDPSAPAVRVSAAEAFAAYASKGYRVVYLTARPEFLTRGTRAWFEAHGMPFGVLHLSQTNFGALGSTAQSYKQAFIEDLARHGASVDWAYGNQDTDLGAYLGAGMDPSRVYLMQYSGDPMGANLIDGWPSEAIRAGCLPPVAP